MSPDATQSRPTTSEAAEPQVLRTPVPVAFILLLFLMLYWGMVYFDQHSGWFSEQVYVPYRSLAEVQKCQPVVGDQAYEQGRVVYERICALCHTPEGTGRAGQAPSFIGSEWVLGSPNRLIRIPQNGLSGPIPLHGEVWNQVPSMAAMGNALSDDDLAAVLTYIRQSWGNKASTVTPQQVHSVREQVGKRSQLWTAEELQKLP
jgi:mono/diheme cytochrome c family protein